MTPGRQYRFGRFRLDGDGHLLFRDEQRIALTPKAVDVLLALVENRGMPVGRQELFTKVWADTVVEDGALSSHISLLRKALAFAEEPELIETIPKRGYRFVGKVEELEHLPARAPRILLAVLPFENLSGSKKHDPFSDGLTEEMITQLGKLNPERLGVIARTSSMTYKSTDKTIEQIGRELNVSHVLEGSARREGSRVRIAAQLIQVSDQTHLWAQSYESDLKDILSLQSNVSRDVARQIQIRLLPSATAGTREVNPVAYEAYLQGRYLWNRRTEHDLRTSIESFEDALRADPAYAPAYAGIADSYLTLMDHGYLTNVQATVTARELAGKALHLDERMAEAHITLGHAAFHEFDWVTADREFSRGIELNPGYTIGRHYRSNFLAAMGRLQEAVAEAEHARQLDPVSPAAHSNLSSILWFSRQYQRCIEAAGKVLELSPDYYGGHEDLGRAYEELGKFAAAITEFQTAVSLAPQSLGTLASLGHAYALSGKRDEATTILDRLHQSAKSSFVTSYNFALVLVGLNRYDDAFPWLEKACDERSGAIPFLKVNPRFARLQNNPRFQRLLDRIGL